jgi:hypothetical protein
LSSGLVESKRKIRFEGIGGLASGVAAKYTNFAQVNWADIFGKHGWLPLISQG